MATRHGLLGSAPALSKTAGSSNLWTCRHQPISLKGEGEVQPGGRWVEGVAGCRAPTCHADVVLHEPDVALGLRGEVLPLPGARGVRLPPRQRLVLHLHLLQDLLVGCEHGPGEPRAANVCADMDLGPPAWGLLAPGFGGREGKWPCLIFSGLGAGSGTLPIPLPAQGTRHPGPGFQGTPQLRNSEAPASRGI